MDSQPQATCDYASLGPQAASKTSRPATNAAICIHD